MRHSGGVIRPLIALLTSCVALLGVAGCQAPVANEPALGAPVILASPVETPAPEPEPELTPTPEPSASSPPRSTSGPTKTAPPKVGASEIPPPSWPVAGRYDDDDDDDDDDEDDDDDDDD